MCIPCKILWYNKTLTATGYIKSKDTSKLVLDVPFGEGCVEVTVQKIHDSDCILMRLLKQYRTIGEGRGTFATCLRAYICDNHSMFCPFSL